MHTPYLEIRTPEGAFQLPLGREALTVGRHSENQLVINDKLVSRFHCVIDYSPQGYIVRDLGASNPTIVNGCAVQSSLLMNGDVISVGATRLVVVIPGGPLRVLSDEGEAEPEAPSADLQALARAAGGSGGVEPSLTEADIGALAPADVVTPVDEVETLTDADIVEGDSADVETLTDADIIEEAEAEVETLGDADIVDEDDTSDDPFSLSSDVRRRGGDDGVIPVLVSDDDDDDENRGSRTRRGGTDETHTYRRDLRILADNSPDRPFAARDIVLVDPQGEHLSPAHGGRGEAGRDALELLREILVVAFRSRATDIHLDPKESSYLLRLRIDGVMMDAASLPLAVGDRLERLVKIGSGIDPFVRAPVQEGHFVARVPSIDPPTQRVSPRIIDHRVSFAQTLIGQKLVIRILDPTGTPARIKDLKLLSSIEAELITASHPEPGMVLVCGPAGSGKTTTLYAIVRTIDVRRRNVVTLEDPVETQIEGVSQLPVDAEAGKSFPVLLRSVLRQDPDVVLISEIRDADTARLATQAAASSRLILSSVHAHDSIGAVGRLIELGVDRYLLAQSLRCVMSQRLIRELCPRCKVPAEPQLELLKDLQESSPVGSTSVALFQPKGCRSCFETGYSGRRVVCEALIVRPPLQEALRKGASAEDLRQAAALDPQTLLSMKSSVYTLLSEGRTSPAEAQRVLSR